MFSRILFNLGLYSSYAAKTIVFKEPVWFGKTAKEWFDKNDFKK